MKCFRSELRVVRDADDSDIDLVVMGRRDEKNLRYLDARASTKRRQARRAGTRCFARLPWKWGR